MTEIIATEKTSPPEMLMLTENEKNILKKIRGKKLFYILSSYLAFIGVIIMAFFHSLSSSYKFGENEVSRFKTLAPYFYAIVFIGLSAYFINYYLKLVHPFVKDVKMCTKEIVFFNPGKYQTPFFAEYYLVTPIKNKLRLKITKELFDAVQTNTPAFISMALHSKFVFTINVNGRNMKFDDSNALIDV